MSKWVLEFEGENWGWGCPALLEQENGPTLCRLADADNPCGRPCPGLGAEGCPARRVEARPAPDALVEAAGGLCDLLEGWRQMGVYPDANKVRLLADAHDKLQAALRQRRGE